MLEVRVQGADGIFCAENGQQHSRTRPHIYSARVYHHKGFNERDSDMCNKCLEPILSTRIG